MQNHSVENYYIGLIARELAISEKQIIGVNRLLDEGATIPFIARYRKEATGNLDEIQLAAVRDKLAYFRDLRSDEHTSELQSLMRLSYAVLRLIKQTTYLHN